MNLDGKVSIDNIDPSKILGYHATQSTDMSKIPQYMAYGDTGKLPVGMKDGTRKAEDFKNQAVPAYINVKNEKYNQSGFSIIDTNAYMGATKVEKDALDKIVQTVPQFMRNLDDLIKFTEENGAENPYSEAGKKMKQSYTAIIMQLKEMNNLGVLNGKDYDVITSQIPDPTSVLSILSTGWSDYPKQLRSARDSIMN